jgi:hypothetical protein
VRADRNGEEDRGMRRGRPLYLDERRYRTLWRSVLELGFDLESVQRP